MRFIGSLLLLLLISCPLHGQVAAAGWCAVKSSSDQSSRSNSTDQPPDDSFPPQSDESNSTTSPLGCDIGVGFSLYTHNRLAVVAVVGSESIGSGIAWILNPNASDNRPVMAVAIGIVTPYDRNGIGRDVQLALGMTFSLRQREE